MPDFSDYQKDEYQYVAQAHLRTIEAISSFFRYYLIIMALPISIIGLLISVSSKEPNIANSLAEGRILFAVVFLVIAAVGLCVLAYTTNLRMDVILYARAVNAIRKYFYDEAPLDTSTRMRLRVLPQTPYQPSYYEPAYFLPVVCTFALFDSFYAFCGLAVLALSKEALIGLHFQFVPWWVYGASVEILFTHWLLYWWYARYREYRYLRSNALGVDVDGVLNLHREHFCAVLRDLTEKEIQPDQISILPVHENAQLGVSRSDERRVFNHPAYWTSMPAIPSASDYLKKIQNSLNVRIHIFSFRPWPELADLPARERPAVFQEWREATRSQIAAAFPEAWKRLWLRIWWREWRSHSLKLITLAWLKRQGIEHSSLLIEAGTENLSDPKSALRNRFTVARRKNIRFFVEDDLEKAIKMAQICDLVFLMNHPYNRFNVPPTGSAGPVEGLPANIVRVDSWDQIYRWVRRLL